ncbi:EAL domain-containing protein [Mesorhizobium sp. CAU 1741]|uniref:putative bifunctional diguanylate cyclase/phosphodiesterase n=1 Tax=Mesorhizobium sp. CAU 1741 TaxID=3140366 RepID=UPI00325BCB4F
MSSTDQKRSGSDRLIWTIKGAYWAAMLIIAGMALASYLLLQHMMAVHQRDEELMMLATSQKALSQRILFLASETRLVAPDHRPPLVASLRDATARFETNYDRLLTQMGARTYESDGGAESILFGAPHHLDHFSTSLIANGWRFVAALESWLGARAPDAAYLGARERADLSETVARATLEGYSALGEKLRGEAQAMLDRLLSVHRVLFWTMIGGICLIVLFIFRPMSELIRRRTGELVEAHDSMAFIAIHDGLTRLYNRAFMRDHFDALIKSAHRRNERLAVIQIDLDRFKQINDTLGHAAGDYVLVTTAERMRAVCRASDICARLGGDEFVMVMPAAGSSQHIEALAGRILRKINEPIVFGGATIFSGASAGIAVYPVDADNPDDLLVHADLALYAAKKQGGGTLSFFSDELRQELDNRKQLERDLVEAIATDGFSVYFQPQVSLSSGDITGVEALLRWDHPVRGMIPPNDFIPVAEKSGVMPAIGRVVITKSIREAASWYRAGIEFGRLAINVSGTELREADFTAFLFDTLSTAGLPPWKLSLEIVESVILDDEQTGTASKLRMIRAAGVHLELDDFGTGYASLAHVNPNEIDRLKIDRRFVQNIHQNDDNSKIVRAITELARGLGISIVAEGAETEEELSSLMAIGCDQVQGYSIAFPMPRNEARRWLDARRLGTVEADTSEKIA